MPHNSSGFIEQSCKNGLSRMVYSNLTECHFKKKYDYYSLKAVTQGAEDYIIDGVGHCVQTNSFLMVNPGQEVEAHVHSSTSVEGLCFFFDTNFVKQIAYAYQNSITENLDNIDQGFDFSLFNFPIHSYQTKLSKYFENPLFVINQDQAFISDFLILLAESLVSHRAQTKGKFLEIEGAKRITKEELYQRIEIGRQFIHDNYSKPISLKQIARAAKLSEYYFHRNFRFYFNQTPHNYLTSIRIGFAKQLLRDSKYSKSEIAAICGFQDTKYFSKVMKKAL